MCLLRHVIQHPQLISDAIDFGVASFSGVTSLDTENAAPFSATVGVTSQGRPALPQLGWPHITVRFYLSTDGVIDPKTDAMLPYFLTQKQRQIMSGKVESGSTASWDIGVKQPGAWSRLFAMGYTFSL